TTGASVMLSDDRLVGDNLTDSYTSASFSDKSAGTAKAVSVSGISMSGADSGNYTLTNSTATTTADITPRALTVTATGLDKVYNGNTIAFAVLSDNRISGDNLSTLFTNANFSDKNVGTAKSISVTGIVVSGPDSGNYTWNTSTTTSANITPRALT